MGDELVMKRTRTREAGLRTPWLTAVLVGSLAVFWMGCNSGDAPPEAPAEQGTLEGGTEASTEAAPEGVAPGEAAPQAAGNVSGRQIMEQMAAAYREATSYGDSGTARLQATMGDQKMDEAVDFAVTFERPNRIRMQVYKGLLVSDGETIHGAALNLPGQVLQKEAPEELTIRNLYSDRVLTAALTQGIAGPSPQVLLLLAEDSLKALLFESQEPELVEPGKIGEESCQRVAVKRPEGTAVFWVDEDTYELRRIEFPTDDLEKAITGGAKLDSISLVADFAGAELGRKLDEKAFAFEVPPETELVEFLVPPLPGQLLAKEAPPFRFTDLSGKTLTPAAFEDKVLVLDFWATWCGPCRMSLPNLEKVRQQFEGNDKVAFLAVSVDQPDVSDQKLKETFEQLKVNVPIARDLEQQSGAAFRISGIPTLYLVGPNGLVQDYEVGGNPNLAETLPQKIEKLLAGENIYEEPLKRYQKELEQLSSPEAASMEQETEIPQADVAPKTEPTSLKLAPLWKTEGLSAPGNILVLPRESGSPQLMVVSDWKSVAEVGSDGKVLATYPLQLPEQEVISFLRTATTAEGKRVFVGSAPGMQQVYGFDDRFQSLFVYPEGALDNPHAGITDVQLADFDANDTPTLVVGYRGDVGVQGVSLLGERIWSNRSLQIVLRLAVGSKGDDGKRTLLCANGSGALAILDAEGKTLREVPIANRMLYWIVAEDLNGDGTPEYCALSATNLGKMTALGIDLEGNELWSYELPEGVHTQPIEPIVAGRLSADGPGVWILAAPDGSLHFLGTDGKLIDQFNYGQQLAGVATAEIEGKPTLLVSTPQQMEAWTIQAAQ